MRSLKREKWEDSIWSDEWLRGEEGFAKTEQVLYGELYWYKIDLLLPFPKL